MFILQLETLISSLMSSRSFFINSSVFYIKFKFLIFLVNFAICFFWSYAFAVPVDMSICFFFFCDLMWEVTLICECWTNHIFLRETHLVIVHYSFNILLHLICWHLEDFCMYIHEGFGLWFSCNVYVMSNWFCYQGNAESFTNQVGSVLFYFLNKNYVELMLFL